MTLGQIIFKGWLLGIFFLMIGCASAPDAGSSEKALPGATKATLASILGPPHFLPVPRHPDSSVVPLFIPKNPIPNHFLMTPVLDVPTIRILTPEAPKASLSAPVSIPPPPAPPVVSPKPPTRHREPSAPVLEWPATPPPMSVPAVPITPSLPDQSAPAEAVPQILPTIPSSVGDVKPEDITAHAGDDVFIQFKKSNWLYLDPTSQQQSVGFLESRREKSGTSFLFRPKNPGTWKLSFQRQDLVTGESENRIISLSVLPAQAHITGGAGDGTLNSAVSAQASPEQASGPLISTGQMPAAVQTLLQNYTPDNSQLNWQIGKLLAQDGQPSEALTYLKRNLNRASPQLRSSLDLATQLAVSDPSFGLDGILPAWSTYGLVPNEQLFLKALGALEKNHEVAPGLDWASRYAGWYPIPTSKDRWLYLTACLLEQPSGQRDLLQAMKLYQTIIDDYPLSDYWIKAGQQASAISRQILDVR